MRAALSAGALSLFVLAVFAACGGSSSETPFPLEPDFARLDAGGPPKASHYVVFTGKKSEDEAQRDAAPPDEK